MQKCNRRLMGKQQIKIDKDIIEKGESDITLLKVKILFNKQ